ncbi:MAG: epimerase [Terracidiphilus sp.]|jgi:uncharacterized protein YbjT (DUF2867 family)
MKVLIFGATDMVGQGVLRECLRAPDVESVTTIGRRVTGAHDSKLREIAHADMLNLQAIEPKLTGFDACFFTLGVSSSGMKEADYERITYGITMAAAQTLSRLNSGMTFIYVLGAGADSSERGRVMWARVKGRTENALLRLPLKAFMFRPGIIEPLDGIQSKTPAYRISYKIAKPLFPLLRWVMPSRLLSTRDIGQAMLAVARRGYEKPILETRDIRAAARG